MPVAELEETTASNRPVVFLPAVLLLQAINQAATETPNGEMQPTGRIAANLIAEVPMNLLGDPDVSSFYEEIHLSWTQGPKQVIVMSFPDRTPLLHHYEQVQHGPSQHGIEDATSARLSEWLRWLRA